MVDIRRYPTDVDHKLARLAYELTDHRRRIAVLFTKTHTRILNPGPERT